MNAKILVVDDDTMVREALVDQISLFGYEADSAEDAPTAISLLGNARYSIVVTDKNMPGIEYAKEGGLDVLRFAKQSNPDCAVIMLTGYPTLDSAVEALRLGAFDYLNKPCTFEEFKTKMERALAYQQTLDPEDTLATYARFRDGLMEFVKEVENATIPLAGDKIDAILNLLAAKLDTFFHDRKKREFVIVQQRDDLGEIEGLAAQLRERISGDDEAIALIDRIIAKARNRP